MDGQSCSSAVESGHKPSDERASGVGRYLYAVVPAAWARQSYECPGIGGGLVYPIVEGDVAAVVSDMPNERIRPERRHLAAHQGVLAYLMAAATPLPMSFGHVADGPEAIQGILRLNQEKFLEQLRRVEGKVEMGLRVSWDVPNIFEYFVGTHPTLLMLRDGLFRGDREPSQADKIELGRAFDRALNDGRAAHAKQVFEVLLPLCAEIRAGDPRDEREVMNLACLVARDAQARFEQGVFDAARLFDNNYSFDYSGPWPPYNFVSGDFQMG